MRYSFIRLLGLGTKSLLEFFAVLGLGLGFWIEVLGFWVLSGLVLRGHFAVGKFCEQFCKDFL